MARRYAAFLSYNRGTDQHLSAVLRDVLENLGRAWHRRRSMRIFRDVAILDANPDAWGAVQQALDDSEFLIVLAAPGAAASEWVNREVEHWLATRSARTILIAVTAGEVAWDRARGDFDWAVTTALPPALRGKFAAEPSWVDLRPTRTLPPKSRAWRVAAAPLAAALRGVPVENVLRQDDLQFRRNRRTAIAVGVALLALTAASTFFAIRADAEARVATSRQLSAQSQTMLDSEPTLAGLLAAAAWRLDENAEARGAMLAALGHPQRAELKKQYVVFNRTIEQSTGWRAVFSPDGRFIVTGGGSVSLGSSGADVWDAVTGRRVGGIDESSSDVTDLAFTPGGELLTARADGTTRVWDLETAQARLTLTGHADRVTRIAVSPDGALIATASSDGTVRVWDALTGAVRQVLPAGLGLVFEPLELVVSPLAMAFSPDGRFLATAPGDGAAVIWDIETGQPAHTLSGHSGPLTAITFSPDGRLVVTASEDDTARVWDAATGQAQHILSGHTAWVDQVAFSLDGALLVTAGGDGTARLWDVATWQTRQILFGHTSGVEAIAFAPDGRHLATASADGTARVWSMASGRSVATLTGHGNSVMDIAFSPDGASAVTASLDGTARLWDIRPDEPLRSLAGHGTSVRSAAVSPDGSLLATASNDGTARVWDAHTGDALHTLTGHTAQVGMAVFSPDGSLLATASNDGTARLWNTATGEPVAALGADPAERHTDSVEAVAFSPDGRVVATGSLDGTARLWDAATGEPVATLADHTDWAWRLAFSPDGRFIATGSTDESARVWDARTGALISVLPHSAPVWGVVFSPDSQQLATVTSDEVALWDPGDGERRRTFTVDMLSGMAEIAFSADGRRLATGATDGAVRVWVLESGDMVSLAGHTAQVQMVAFSPAGNLLATASDDGTARLWDPESGRVVRVLSGHGNGVNAVAFSPDGRTLVTASIDATAKIWAVPLIEEDLYAQLCARIGRSMTHDEWATYVGRARFPQVC